MARKFKYSVDKGVSMYKYVVDKDVPVPNTAKRNNYPFPQMGVGDSFLIPPEDYKQIYSAASYYGKRNNKKFSIRSVAEGYRCWRVE